MNKSLIVKIGGTVSALIFALGAFIPIASVELFGTKMSTAMTDSTDWILVVLTALLGIAAFWLSEDISVDICAATAGLIAYGKLNKFFDESMEQASQFITKEGGFYCLLIGAVLLIIFGIVSWFIKDTPKSKKKKKEDTRKCPFCAETIKADALLCRFCGSKLEPVTIEEEPEPEEDNNWKGIAKQGGRLVLSIAMFIACITLATFVVFGVLGSSGTTENSGENSNVSAEYDYSNPFDFFGNNESDSEYDEPTEDFDNEVISIPDTEPEHVETTRVETTTVTTTTKATTTTTAATEPDVMESDMPFDISKLDQIYFMQQSGFDMFEPEIKAYIVIYSENNFIFGSSDYYKNTEYYGTWEYAPGPKGYETMLCTINTDENGKSYGTAYQFTISIGYNDPSTAHISLNCDFDFDVFGYMSTGDIFTVY